MSTVRISRDLIGPGPGVGWRPVWSVPAALRGVRAAVVVCGLFAFTDQVLARLLPFLQAS